MSDERPRSFGQVEWLSVGGPSADPTGRLSVSRPWLFVLVLALVAGMVIGLVIGERAGPEVSGPVPLRAPAGAVIASPTAQPNPVVVTAQGYPVLGVTAKWELFGKSFDGVVRIQLALGRITSTPVPGLPIGAPATLIAGYDRVVLRPLFSGQGYAVLDGHPAQPLSGKLIDAGPAFSGPDSRHLWVEVLDGNRPSFELVSMSGQSVNAAIRVPGDRVDAVSSDGGGFLLFTGTGGIYDLRPDGLRRITTGTMLAVGPSGWLVSECDNRYRCSAVVVDRATGARRTLGTTPDGVFSTGVISPDGCCAALLRTDLTGLLMVRIVDLRSGVYQSHGVLVADGPSAADELAWSPDSRMLFAAEAYGNLAVLDKRGSIVQLLASPLPELTELAVRPADPSRPGSRK